LLVANFVSNFTPSFLFQHGDRGDHWTMIHPPHFGELLPEQAVLIALALIVLLGSVRRKVAILILAWVLFAAVPAALIKPLGVGFYQPGNVPTPWALITSKIIPTPVTPSMLLDHTDSRHGAMAMAPWILMSALGFVVLLDLTSRSVVLRSSLFQERVPAEASYMSEYSRLLQHRTFLKGSGRILLEKQHIDVWLIYSRRNHHWDVARALLIDRLKNFLDAVLKVRRSICGEILKVVTQEADAVKQNADT